MTFPCKQCRDCQRRQKATPRIGRRVENYVDKHTVESGGSRAQPGTMEMLPPHWLITRRRHAHVSIPLCRARPLTLRVPFVPQFLVSSSCPTSPTSSTSTTQEPADNSLVGAPPRTHCVCSAASRAEHEWTSLRNSVEKKPRKRDN